MTAQVATLQIVLSCTPTGRRPSSHKHLLCASPGVATRRCHRPSSSCLLAQAIALAPPGITSCTGSQSQPNWLLLVVLEPLLHFRGRLRRDAPCSCSQAALKLEIFLDAKQNGTAGSKSGLRVLWLTPIRCATKGLKGRVVLTPAHMPHPPSMLAATCAGYRVRERAGCSRMCSVTAAPPGGSRCKSGTVQPSPGPPSPMCTQSRDSASAQIRCSKRL